MTHAAPPSRRDLMALAGGALLSGLTSCRSSPSQDAPARLSDPLFYSSTTALAQAIRKKEISSEELVKACLARIEAVNPKLNAVVQLGAERALSQARQADQAIGRGESGGVLHGVPMTIKDSLDTTGMVTTGGTKGRSSFVPKEDATVVARLRAAGAILLGKTNTPEFTLSFETNNLVYGRTNNPYDVTRTSGGSSGGAAAIVASGGAPFDIGSDYGGSIRLPAHFCGIAGIKPSAGRVPRTGHIYPFGGIQDSFQQIGPLARYVDDLALLLPIIAGPDWVDPAIVDLPLLDPRAVDLRTLRISFHTDNGVLAPTKEIAAVVRAAAKVLSDQRAMVEEARPTGIEESYDLVLGLYFFDGGAAIARLLREAGTTEHSFRGLDQRKPLSVVELDALIARWYAFRSRMLSFLKKYDVIICPVNANPALPHGSTEAPDAYKGFTYTMTYNMTGWPGAVVRGGASSEGLPVGVQVISRPGREDVALAVAKHLETALGGFAPPTL
jgi:amidase